MKQLLAIMFAVIATIALGNGLNTIEPPESVPKIVNATKVLQLTHPLITNENYQDLKLTNTFLEKISFREWCPAKSTPCSVLLVFDQLSFSALVQQTKENEDPFLLWGERKRRSSSRTGDGNRILPFHPDPDPDQDCNDRGPGSSINQCLPPDTGYDVVKTLDCCCYRNPETGELTVTHTEKTKTFNCETDCRVGLPETTTSTDTYGPTASCPCGSGECQ